MGYFNQKQQLGVTSYNNVSLTYFLSTCKNSVFASEEPFAYVISYETRNKTKVWYILISNNSGSKSGLSGQTFK